VHSATELAPLVAPGEAGATNAVSEEAFSVAAYSQLALFPDAVEEQSRDHASSTFADNTKLPIHRWIRYSAGFSGAWVERLLKDAPSGLQVFDPFAGSGTTLIAAEQAGAPSWGVESHPFVARIASAKLEYRSSIEEYRDRVDSILAIASQRTPKTPTYPDLIQRCYTQEALQELDALRQSLLAEADESPASQLAWLNLVSILRRCSCVNTASWQYVLPRKSKKNPQTPFLAFRMQADAMIADMRKAGGCAGPRAKIAQADARDCPCVPTAFANLVVTSPPYPNNYDYADATRLEMTFFREIESWSELQEAVRTHLVRSCSQHVPERKHDLEDILSRTELDPIRQDIERVCSELAEVRKGKGGKKTYHLMVACYFCDLAQVWRELRRICDTPSRVCFVVGDSAPYGVYVPVQNWLTRLAENAGFVEDGFEETRKRNVKWKNRKHRVPLCEGRLWLRG
jgi:hypothetical protein